MASGRGHEQFNLTSLGILAAAYGVSELNGWNSQLGISRVMAAGFFLTFIFGTFLVTPDLDLAENHVLSKKNWGILGFIWVPYGYVFSHRGMSHGWILGPLTRLFYLVGLAVVMVWTVTNLFYIVGYQFEVQASWGPNNMIIALSGLFGFYLSQWLHLVADNVKPWHALSRFFKK